ncbi:hypothetical protein RUND412_005330 [Rhizina undulata]
MAPPRLPLRPLAIIRLLPRSTAPALPRFYSSTPGNTPKLAKPTKFTPPSHPPSLPRNRAPVNYPGPPPTRDPATAQYPNTMPPPESWTYWFLTNRRLHFYLSLSILFSMAAFAGVVNFLKTSPYANMVSWSWTSPISSVGTFMRAYKLHAEDESKRIAEIRRKKVEDVEKRGEFRRAHGLERTGEEGGFGGWGVKKSGREPVAEPNMDLTSPTGGRGGWIGDEIRNIEEEAARAALTEAGSGQTQEVTEIQAEPREGDKKNRWW